MEPPPSRHTRRNTHAATIEDGGSASPNVMDPWKDDRLRDFVVLNVMRRVRSFHLPSGAPTADVGEGNRQRAEHLFLLSRTEACCSGSEADCTMRRNFCRIFGPSLLQHGQHASGKQPAVTPPPFPLDLQGSATKKEVKDQPQDEVVIKKEDDTMFASPTATTLDTRPLTPERQVMKRDDEDEAAGSKEMKDLLLASIDTTPSVMPPLTGLTTAAGGITPCSIQQRSSLASTAGTSTPLDYSINMDCSCCPECDEAIALYFQSMLNKIIDRFSQRELLFAQWVLFRNMEPKGPLDSSMSGRKEALLIKVKSGYYELLTKPKVSGQSPSTNVGVEATFTEGDSSSLNTTVPVSKDEPAHQGRSKRQREEPHDVAKQREPEAKEANKIATVRRKRGDPPAIIEPTVDDPSLAGRRYPTRRAVAQQLQSSSRPRDDAFDLVSVSSVVTTMQQSPVLEPQPVSNFSFPAAPLSEPQSTSTKVTGRRKAVVAVKQQPPEDSQPDDPASGGPRRPKPVTKDEMRAPPKRMTRSARERADDLFPDCVECPNCAVPERVAQPVRSSWDEFDLKSVSVASAAASAAQPIRRYDFAQQCLLLLTASRMANNNVEVGPMCPPPAVRHAPRMDYWRVAKEGKDETK